MKRPLIAALMMTATLATPALSFDLEKMSDAERAAFRAEIKSYLMENPQVIMEAVSVLEQREAEQKQAMDVQLVQTNKQDLLNDPTSYVGGNPDGDITIVEFVDYRCGYCRKAYGEVAQLLKEDGNIRLITKEFPILGPDSTTSSRFALAVREVAGDEAYHAAGEMLIKLKTGVEEPVLRRLADSLGVDADAVLAKMDSDEVNDIIAANHMLGQRLQINGTPTFVIGDEMLRGYVPLAGMMQIVGEQRDKAE
ncbi:DsbA family protein [Rhodalgimonas zhirmunskyi]|uniref:DsbA family protein n=1 Tax=Rhodalgimonas zhirmunskyi TaxID=2964767 RepID=A0AAJ1U7L8_9RHOB|nr:DsbA family protein [Rhodoalgimonas zhirmunskyi]MDQ2092548.1 DsbA family protein [Rhodoalgimonas zhirmunskyi]